MVFSVRMKHGLLVAACILAAFTRASGAPLPIVRAITKTLVKEQSDLIVTENELATGKFTQNATGPRTRLCLYRNGATVSIAVTNRLVQSGQKCVWKNLSQSVLPDTLCVRCPDQATLQEYWISKPEPNDKPNKTKSAIPRAPNALEVTDDKSVQRVLHMVIDGSDKLTPNDKWEIQYTVRDVSWKANHVIEFSSEWNHITFRTTVDVCNTSGIHFENADVQFLDCDLPQCNTTPPSNAPASPATAPWVIYQSPAPFDLPNSQKKKIVWSDAKRVAITTKNGLFVGGQYLKKMREIASPQIEKSIIFSNMKEVGLGAPLPSGEVTLLYNNENFVSLLGYSYMNAVRAGGDATVRMPRFSQKQHHQHHTKDKDAYYALSATLVQESYQEIAPKRQEARYKLTISNVKSEQMALTVTVDCEPGMRCSAKSDRNHLFERNKDKELTCTLIIPPKSSQEIRYTLLISRD